LGEAETRIRRRGRRYAVLGVEDSNPRARALYERLGYVPFRRERASWRQDGPVAGPELYETEITLLRKVLVPETARQRGCGQGA
jgi:ribosomal protein S18 acetylase RimI-like enzyme